jgi:hypothetical protein
MHSRKTIIIRAVSANVGRPELHPQRAEKRRVQAFDTAYRAAGGAARDKSNLRGSLDKYSRDSSTNMCGKERVATLAMPAQ